MQNIAHAQVQQAIGTTSAPATDLYIEADKYLVQLARTPDMLDAALRLRFDVFNLELGEGLAESYQTGRDQDMFDVVCDHLLVIERESGVVVGTYRLQTYAMAANGHGFYSTGEFDLSALPQTELEQAVEIGRACIARDHRNSQVLYLLWKGLLTYLTLHKQRYLFGCCSLTSQNPQEGLAAFALLQQQGALHPQWHVAPHAAFLCHPEQNEPVEVAAVRIPKLFRNYLRYGAYVCSQPAIDRVFKTIDFLVLFDFAAMDGEARRFFLGE